MTLLGTSITLVAKSHKAKRILDKVGHTTEWMVLAETDKPLFNPTQGPSVFVKPMTTGENNPLWVKLSNDVDFDIQ